MKLARQIAGHDGVLIVTPEYNGSIPPLLKNTIDWMSRIRKDNGRAFKPLDGKFDDNVAVQVKNGPIDFQPREPFSPLFGAVPKTNIFMEFQITKEYLGHATHLAYLGTMWSEALKSDTFARGKGSTVARVVDGSLFGNRLTGIAAVANTGENVVVRRFSRFQVGEE